MIGDVARTRKKEYGCGEGLNNGCSVERKEGGKGKIKQIQYLNFNL